MGKDFPDFWIPPIHTARIWAKSFADLWIEIRGARGREDTHTHAHRHTHEPLCYTRKSSAFVKDAGLFPKLAKGFGKVATKG